MILPDLLSYKMDIVFCGTAASKKSKSLNAYYAGPGNKFWKTLYDIGLTKKHLKPQEFKKLLDYDIELTDICKTDYGNDNELDTSKYDVEGFNLKILEYKPKTVCFNGKNAGKAYLNQKKVNYGYHDIKIGNTKIFIAPSTSGAASGFWNLTIWKQLPDF